MKYADMTWGTMEAVVNRLGGTDGVRDLLNGSLQVVRKFFRTLTSDGTKGKQWTSRLEQNGYRVGGYATKLLCSDAFVVIDVVTYEYDLVVIKGDEFAINDERTTEAIRALAKSRGYLTPPAEVAPLLREAVSDEEIAEMGLRALVVMHEPITGSGVHPGLLAVDRVDEGRWLYAYDGRPGIRWYRESCFVFLAPRRA